MKRAWILAPAVLVILFIGLLSMNRASDTGSHILFGFSAGTQSSASSLPVDSSEMLQNQRARLSQALRLLHALELRDSAVAVLRARQPADTQQFRVEVSGTEATSSDIETFTRLLEMQWDQLNLGQPIHPIVAVVRIDSVRSDFSDDLDLSEAGGSDIAFGPPPPGTSGACLTVVRIALPPRQANVQTEIRARALSAPMLGLCAYYAAFGPPGRGVAAWLEARDYDVARASWTLDDRMPAQKLKASHYILHPLHRVAGEDEQLSTSPLAVALQRCTDGEASACRDLVLAPGLRPGTPTHDGSTLPSAPAAAGTVEYFELTTESSRSVTDRFLAALVANDGRGRFERFWKSDADAPIAFERAMGQPLGDWVRTWVHHTIGNTVRGTRLPILTWLICLAILLAAGIAISSISEGRVVR
jgi:hypothetical protein